MMGKIESDRLESFRRVRKQGNRKIPEADHPGMKQFINPDANSYKDGALAGETKELLGLVASAVLLVYRLSSGTICKGWLYKRGDCGCDECSPYSRREYCYSGYASCGIC